MGDLTSAVLWQKWANRHQRIQEIYRQCNKNKKKTWKLIQVIGENLHSEGKYLLSAALTRYYMCKLHVLMGLHSNLINDFMQEGQLQI